LNPERRAYLRVTGGSLRRLQMIIGITADSHDNFRKVRRETLLVNPGECGRWLTGRSNVGLVDLDKLEGKIL